MRARVIPAQITTVEDKIVGSLNLTQLCILMIPIFWATLVYIFLPPRMHLLWYKLPVVLVVLFLCLILSLRIKGKVVVNWLGVLFRYNLRTRYYIADKNDTYLRTMYLPTFEKRKTSILKQLKKKKVVNVSKQASLDTIVQFEHLLADPRYTFSLKTKEKGGMHVAIEQIKN